MRTTVLALTLVLAALTAPRSLRADETELECNKCHDDVMRGSYTHEPAVLGDCLTCHNIHKDDPSTALKAPVTELCLGCHDAKILRLEGGHMVQGHPYWIKEDPFYVKEDPRKRAPEFNCTNCHNPHSSNQPYLFPADYTKKPYDGNLCVTCHVDQIGGELPPGGNHDSPRLPPRGGKPAEPPCQKKHWWEWWCDKP